MDFFKELQRSDLTNNEWLGLYVGHNHFRRDPNKETFEDDYGHVLHNVHRREECNGVCVIHNPTNHHMRSWPLLWRNDRSLFERMCPTHRSASHPDPDHLASLRERKIMSEDDLWAESIHGCCGCCR